MRSTERKSPPEQSPDGDGGDGGNDDDGDDGDGGDDGDDGDDDDGEGDLSGRGSIYKLSARGNIKRGACPLHETRPGTMRRQRFNAQQNLKSQN